ncbi:MAG: methyltransferase domain-containing protein [Magnetococcus sp. DMHC-1]|nr:methyltransferase domain-containing protein [Magnetococcales bacterium]
MKEKKTMEQRSISEHHATADRFDAWYRTMRTDYRLTAFTYGRKKIDEVLDQVLNTLPSGARILDVGCGTGEQVARFRQRGFEVVGMEPAENMRLIAQRNNPGVQILDGTATRLPFPDQHFNLVTAFEVYRYFSKPELLQSFREAVRVTQPEGKFFFTMVNRYAMDGFYLYDGLRHLLANLRGSTPPIHCEFTTPAEIQTIFKHLGIHHVTCQGRMFGLLRLIYRLHEGLGAKTAARFESLDDRLSQASWSIPLAGHLIVTAVPSHDQQG